jgi:hypothetical protein
MAMAIVLSSSMEKMDCVGPKEFASVQKTKTQRLKLMTEVLGPPECPSYELVDTLTMITNNGKWHT